MCLELETSMSMAYHEGELITVQSAERYRIEPPCCFVKITDMNFDPGNKKQQAWVFDKEICQLRDKIGHVIQILKARQQHLIKHKSNAKNK